LDRGAANVPPVAEIGLLLSIPSFVSLAVEPVLGVVAVTWRRRVLVRPACGA
jgi:hypothetical protein